MIYISVIKNFWSPGESERDVDGYLTTNSFYRSDDVASINDKSVWGNPIRTDRLITPSACLRMFWNVMISVHN